MFLSRVIGRLHPRRSEHRLAGMAKAMKVRGRRGADVPGLARSLSASVWAASLLATLSACGAITAPGPVDSPPDASGPTPDASVSTLSPDGECDLAKPFLRTRMLTELGDAIRPALTADELVVYYDALGGMTDLYMASRATPLGRFNNPTPVRGFERILFSALAGVSADGQRIYVVEIGAPYLLRSARRVDAGPDEVRFELDADGLRLPQRGATVSADERTLVHEDANIVGRTRVLGGPWSEPRVVVEEGRLGALGADGLAFVYEREWQLFNGVPQPASVGYATRASTSEPFGTPSFAFLPPGTPSWLSPNGCRMYYYLRRDRLQPGVVGVAERSL